MAKTGAVSFTPNAVGYGQSTTATFTLTNNDTNPVQITAIQPFITDGGGSPVSANVGQVGFGPNANNQAFGGGGTVNVTFPVNFFTPQTKASAAGATPTQTYTLNVFAYWTDLVSGATGVVTPTASMVVTSMY
jgi:hypothetical protein